MLKDKLALYFADKVVHPPTHADTTEITTAAVICMIWIIESVQRVTAKISQIYPNAKQSRELNPSVSLKAYALRV
jgi:hypothetical protein